MSLLCGQPYTRICDARSTYLAVDEIIIRPLVSFCPLPSKSPCYHVNTIIVYQNPSKTSSQNLKTFSIILYSLLWQFCVILSVSKRPLKSLIFRNIFQLEIPKESPTLTFQLISIKTLIPCRYENVFTKNRKNTFHTQNIGLPHKILVLCRYCRPPRFGNILLHN